MPGVRLAFAGEQRRRLRPGELFDAPDAEGDAMTRPNRTARNAPRKAKPSRGIFGVNKRTDATQDRRMAVFAALWQEPEYLRLQATKDAALKRWNERDAYRKMYSDAERREADADARAALKACRDYEDTALTVAGAL